MAGGFRDNGDCGRGEVIMHKFITAFMIIVGIAGYAVQPEPPSRGEVHHAKHAGSGGPDKEDNLIHLSYETHRFKAHGLSGTRKQYMDEQIKTYLNCHAVKEWRKEHEMELQELYKTEEERRIKKKRAGCIPKKPKWAKY